MKIKKMTLIYIKTFLSRTKKVKNDELVISIFCLRTTLCENDGQRIMLAIK